MLIAALAAALLAGVAGTTSIATASAPHDLKISPKALNFGHVAVGDSMIKPVTLINRTGYTLTYVGAYWPNFGNPSGWPGWPYGFWAETFPCETIAANTSCTADFRFTPFEPGEFGTHFQVWYTDGVGGSYTDSFPMRGTGEAP